MAATGNAGEVPTFKLVLVGDGGTGALFLFFFFLFLFFFFFETFVRR